MNFDQAPKQEPEEKDFEKMLQELVEERSLIEEQLNDDELSDRAARELHDELKSISQRMREIIKQARGDKKYPENLIQEEKDDREGLLAYYKNEGYDAAIRDVDISLEQAESGYEKLQDKTGDLAEEKLFRIEFFKSIKKEIEELENNK